MPYAITCSMFVLTPFRDRDGPAPVLPSQYPMLTDSPASDVRSGISMEVYFSDHVSWNISIVSNEW